MIEIVGWLPISNGESMERNTDNDMLVENQLREWDGELHAAARMLQGKHRDKFKSIISSVAKLIGLQTQETSPISKLEPSDVSPHAPCSSSWIEDMRTMFAAMKPAERMIVIDGITTGFCRHCGDAKLGTCHCTNDG